MAFFTGMLNAQPSYSVSGGVKLINSEPHEMTLWYIDESPSHDNIYTTFSPIGNISVNLGIRWQDNLSEKAFRLFVEGQGYVGSVSGLALIAGYSYCPLVSGKVKFQPELSAVLGYCSKGIGAIDNNDVYIQVNQTKFQDYTNVYVSLRNAYIGIKPGVSLTFDIGNEKAIGLGVNYQLSYKAGFVNFRGTGEDGNPATDSESLTARNVGFYVDGTRTSDNPYNPDGLEFKLFYCF